MNKICILIPSYNNGKTVEAVLREVLLLGLPVIVVNDGSTDNTSDILERIDGIVVLTHVVNRGKGVALQTGFNYAHDCGFDYAITLDSDGQHDPSNIMSLYAEVKDVTHPVLVMGSRNMQAEGIPKKSSFGNSFSNFWFHLETGIKLSDTQTGFRAYPIASIVKKKWFTNRFEHEIELIVRLAWAGVEVKEVPVAVYYPEDRVSHFRPFNDFARISVLNTVLVFLTAVYYLPKRLMSISELKRIARSLRNEVVMHKDNPVQLAKSIGVGLFFGIFPIWGFQMLVAFYSAKVFKLNSIIVLAVSNVSLPPLLPFILYFSLLTGKVLFQSEHVIPALGDLSLEHAKEYSLQYFSGAAVFAILMGAVGFVFSYGLLKVIKLLSKS